MFLFLHTGFLQTFWKHLTHPGFTMNLNNGQQPLHNRLKAMKTLKQTQQQFKKLQSAVDFFTCVCR